MAGSSFAVGIGYVSRWFSMESQGSALGVYGLGNIGQSAAVFLGPVVAATFGFRTVYTGMSIILIVWAVVFVAFARNATQITRPKGLSEMLGVLEPRAPGMATCRVLFSDLWWIRCLLDLSPNIVARPVWVETSPMPVFAPRASSCLRLCADLSADGSPTALEVRGFFPGFCPPLPLSGYCSACNR